MDFVNNLQLRNKIRQFFHLCPRIIVLQYFPKAASRSGHGIGPVLAHAHPMAEALGSEHNFPRLHADRKGCGGQSEQLPQPDAGIAFPADFRSEERR